MVFVVAIDVVVAIDAVVAIDVVIDLIRAWSSRRNGYCCCN